MKRRGLSKQIDFSVIGVKLNDIQFKNFSSNWCPVKIERLGNNNKILSIKPDLDINIKKPDININI